MGILLWSDHNRVFCFWRHNIVWLYHNLILGFKLRVSNVGSPAALHNITNYLSDGTEFCIREQQTSNAFKLNNIETLEKLCPIFNLRYRMIVESKKKLSLKKIFQLDFTN